ncbi:MAG: DUF2304 domain-containing protein [Deltaproteobacteria bacterium]|nr:DUF2304 domain-containing protein [Deltaproteobacteria bacterium]
MTMFQQIGLALMAIMMAMSIYAIVRRRGRLRVSIFWLLLWGTAAAVLIRPELAVETARAMGIGRGADLIFYCNVLLTLIGFFTIYLRQRRIEHHITLLVRELALARSSNPPPLKSIEPDGSGESDSRNR